MRNTILTWQGWRRRVAALLALAGVGWGLSFVGSPAARWQIENQPAFHAGSLEGVVGQGVLLGMFGGFRAIMADIAWVRSYVHWERRDRAACESLMRMSIALDPANTYFWLNTGDVIAYNMPHWEIQARERSGQLKLAEPVQAQIKKDFAEQGLALLAEGAQRNPRKQADFWIRSAHVCIIRLEEPERGAEFYRQAAECENPAWYAGVSYARLLGNVLGKKQEAIQWLRGYRKKLLREKAPDPYDMLGLIEEELGEMSRGIGE